MTWNDDSSTENLNDTEDTSIAIDEGNAIVQVNIVFEQQIGS